MTVAVTDVMARFPAFSQTDVYLVQRCIDESARRVNPDVFGDRTDDAVLLLTGHKLALTPGAEHLRLDPKMDPQGDGTLMGREHRELCESIVLTPVVG